MFSSRQTLILICHLVYTYGNFLLQAYQTNEEPTATSTYETYFQTHQASGVATYQNTNSVF